ncbi:hypothetical protein FHX10_006538 [Rhizobium sp. BK591]|nr:hypothetical protein [Rhizobium sp. BK591]
MKFVTTPDASLLTGLSTATLREWTSRRALIPADFPPKSKGSPAGFTWQTVLLLRIAAALRDRFHLELQFHQSLFTSLKTGLRKTSFIALRDKTLILEGGNLWSLEDEASRAPSRDGILIVLHPHLEVLARGFGLSLPTRSTGQLELFPVRALDPVDHASIGISLVQPDAGKRRRSV